MHIEDLKGHVASTLLVGLRSHKYGHRTGKHRVRSRTLTSLLQRLWVVLPIAEHLLTFSAGDVREAMAEIEDGSSSLETMFGWGGSCCRKRSLFKLVSSDV